MRATQSLGVSAVLAAGLVSAQAQTCYSGINIFTARGTGEVPPTGLGIEGTHINAVLDAVPNSHATVIEYPATFGNSSVPAGVQDSNEKIAAYLDACPTSKIVVMGYSQGAVVQGLVLTGTSFSINAEGQAEDYTVPPLPQKYVDQIAAIVFFGDPGYNQNIGTNLDNPNPCTTGARTPRSVDAFGKFGDRLAEWANADDIYACSTGTSFAAHISYFSTANATLTAKFVAGKVGVSAGSPGDSSSSVTTPTRPAYYPPTTPIVHPSTGRSVSQIYATLSKPSRPTASGSRIPVSRASTASRASQVSSASGTGRLPAPATSTATTSPTLTPSRGDAPSLGKPMAAVLGGLALPLLFL
ncbi:carbohydrate esterase family 5 protein [Dissoconium aciculare CBS 342.82]|uniref:Carbohydrate esterase family 5 protein n=1 Tax=Dissoconium aciculare CBS 342.82 TaxID=1314786 RepID=A0A6J3LZ52_9PEZI|nr:carbohydrate esterase family 5 protein [Dissoconium aciculare CBS 342.82]KAF1820559.1 carbohydrate esterase family 5 protein [Dissoconium aciculare CBS 342.82]